MQSSLILQSRELIEKLNHKKCQNREEFNSARYSDNAEILDELLTDRHNLRMRDSAISKHNLSDSIPKSTVTSILSRSAYLSKSMPKRVPFGISNYAHQLGIVSDKSANLRSLDLMGYDWIAGMMENKAKETQLDQPREYFEELEKFRRQNKQYCISSENRQPSNATYSPHQSGYKKAFNDFSYNFQPNNPEGLETSEEKQPEVYAYTLNERLFPIPLDLNTAERGLPDPNNPHIIKISIPSNRFMHRNQKIQTMKEKTSVHQPQVDSKLMGESLSLSSHCQLSRTSSVPIIHSQKKGLANNKCSHQEPASLRGHILMNSAINGNIMPESMSPFGGNQPRSQQEAIDQLQRGKTGAKLSRMVPSALVNRSLNIESLPDAVNICQTRITLKDMDDCTPRSPIKTGHSKETREDEPRLSPGVPRASLSRQQMSKVYGDAMRSVWENADSRH